MTCIVCHRTVGTRAKKCPSCGAPTTLNIGEYLFEMNSADQKQLKKYYEQKQETQAEADAEKSYSGRSAVSDSSVINTSAQSSSVSSQTVSGNSATLDLEENGMTLLKGIGYTIVALFIIGLVWAKAMWLCTIGVSLLAIFEGYLIYSQTCYSRGRALTFWICIVLFVAFSAFGFVFGTNDTSTFGPWIQRIVEGVKSDERDIVEALISAYKTNIKTTTLSILPMTFLNLFLVNSLVNYEEDDSTKNRVVFIISIVLFLLFVAISASILGSNIALKNEISSYFNGQFPNQTIVF